MAKILIVEDDLDIQELLQNFLQEAGYEVSIANDGVEAVSLFSTAHYDLILLDVMLPKIDGFTVCELIRKQSQIPIITITAFQRNENVVFELENTGVHIPENEIPKLFDAFYRIEHSRNRKTGGSGLGLYIVKAILEQHQATYSINNTSNGVLFSIHF